MKFYHLILALLFALISAQTAFSQKLNFSSADSLRGTLNADRSCFDVHFYDIAIDVAIDEQEITGNTGIYFTAVRDFSQLQIDLFANLTLDSIVYHSNKLRYTRIGNAIKIHVGKTIPKNESDSLRIFYHGKPTVAIKPPWDGGFVWSKDSLGNPWVAVTCEGIGASLWWPNKDHLSDKADSLCISISAPESLSTICNGTLVRTYPTTEKRKVSEWKISYPIQNYNVTLYIGKYSSIQDWFMGKNGDSLALNYYILKYNENIANKHFQQVKPMLRCYEHYFGNYPFPKDGYALVEAPYWGMEHQGAIAYGNKFRNDVLDFDFIILHESAHEWWGNSVSVADHAEMWIHEAFATYSESLLLESIYGKTTAIAYLTMQRKHIKNTEPILGPLGVNYDGWDDADMYYKGAWMLHTLRHAVNNDTLWFAVLKKIAQNFKYKTISSEMLIDYMNKELGKDYTLLFDQYLKQTKIPTLTYELVKTKGKYQLRYHWENTIANFVLPIIITYDHQETVIYPTTTEQISTFSIKKITSFRILNELYYLEEKRINH